MVANSGSQHVQSVSTIQESPVYVSNYVQDLRRVCKEYKSRRCDGGTKQTPLPSFSRCMDHLLCYQYCPPWRTSLSYTHPRRYKSSPDRNQRIALANLRTLSTLTKAGLLRSVSARMELICSFGQSPDLWPGSSQTSQCFVTGASKSGLDACAAWAAAISSAENCSAGCGAQ